MGVLGDIILNETKKKLGRMVAAGYTLILTPNRSKKVWPPRKSPQNRMTVMCISLIHYTCLLYNNQLKYKKRRIIRRRISPTKRIRREENNQKLKRREEKEETEGLEGEGFEMER
jgi:hypothetical protein